MQPVRGTCRCGQVEVEVAKPPLMTMACHCRGCQKMTSSAFSLSAAVPADGFRVVRGEPAIGGMHGELQHFFCPWCMSWMFTKMPGMDFVGVRTTLLDGMEWTEPFVETWTDEKLAWAATPARRSFPGFPPADAWPAMIAEFQSRQAGGSDGGG